MNVVATLTCAVVFASFGWGVLRFFGKPAGPSWPALVTAASGLFFGACHLLAMATASTGTGRLLLGSISHLCSAALFWSAVRACQSRRLSAIFERDLPVRLIAVGPYAHVRHPFYTAYTIFWLGGWVASGTAMTALSVPVMLGIYVLGAREEERKFSRSPLAAEYASYRRRVGAWLPRLTGRRTSTDR